MFQQHVVTAAKNVVSIGVQKYIIIKGFKLEISFEWSTTRICTRAYRIFNIRLYINDLEEDATSKMLKFADGTNLLRQINGNGDKQQLQDDIDKLIKWSEKWQVLFNFLTNVNAYTQGMETLG